MADKITTIERKELYERVWNVPMTKLAKQYGISDVGLKKICKKLNVPTPPRGYWVRIQHGQRVQKTPLPKKEYGAPSSHEIIYDNEIGHAGPNTDDDLPDELKTLGSVRVPKALRKPHALVKNNLSVFSKAKPDEYGVVTIRKNSCLDIRVSPKLLKRSLRIMDGLFKCFEDLGYELMSGEGDYSPVSVKILGEAVDFSLNERVRRIPHEPTQKEIENQKRYSWDTPKPWDYEPTGKLTLSLSGYYAQGLRKNWSDTKRRHVEELLADIVRGAYRMARVKRERRIEREEEQRRWEEERRRRQEEAERLERERKRFSDLEDQVERWVKVKKLRAYLKEVEGAALKANASEIQGIPIQEWLSWARNHADRIDLFKNWPLGSGYESE